MVEKKILSWVLLIAISTELLMLNQLLLLTAQWTWVLGIFVVFTALTALFIADLSDEDDENPYLQQLQVS